MPVANRFRPQDSAARNTQSLVELKAEEAQPRVGSGAFFSAMHNVERTFRAAEVGAILLIASGRGVGLHRRTITGTFTRDYADILTDSVNQQSRGPRIDVRLLDAGTLTDHLSRADAAIRALDILSRLSLEAGERVLIWGHGHGGNVAALLTNLLAADPATLATFFKAATPEAILFRAVTGAKWRTAARLLASELGPLERNPLDIVTFGTPPIYGWDATGYENLLHIVSTCQAEEAKQPRVLSRLNPVAWRARRQLRSMLEGEKRDDLGCSVRHDEGETIAVAYPSAKGDRRRTYFDHQTHERWMAFHAQQVAQRMFAIAMPEARHELRLVA